MLQAVDERLSIWGWETGTGTRFAVVVDAWGKDGNKGLRGVSDGDLRGVGRYDFVFTESVGLRVDMLIGGVH